MSSNEAPYTRLVPPLSERASTRYEEQRAQVPVPFMNLARTGGSFGIWCGVGVVLVMYGLGAPVPTSTPSDPEMRPGSSTLGVEFHSANSCM